MLDLLMAAKEGDLEKVRELIEPEKVIDTGIDTGIDGAIYFAATNGHIEIVKLLIAHTKVTPDGADNAIKGAAREGHIEIVKQLLIAHTKVTDTSINRAILGASEKDHIEIVKLLIGHKKVTTVGVRDAIKCAAIMGHVEIVKLLLSYGVGFNTQWSMNDSIRNLFSQIKNNQEIISPLLEKGFAYVEAFTDEQKKAFSNEISLAHIIAKYFNPKIFNNSIEENKKSKREILLNLAIANPHIQFDKILVSNPHLIKFLCIYVKEHEYIDNSKVIKMLFNAASCLIKDNLSKIRNSRKRIEELNQKEYKNLDTEERKELNYFKGLEELNNQLEEDKKGLETNEVFKFRNKLKARNKFSDIEIITSSNKRTIKQVYESDEEKEDILPRSKRLKIDSGSSSRNR